MGIHDKNLLYNVLSNYSDLSSVAYCTPGALGEPPQLCDDMSTVSQATVSYCVTI